MNAPFSSVRTAGQEHNPAIVFLHGGGLNSSEWLPQLEGLGGRFYCLAPDLPEQGQSVSVPFSLTDAARRVVELIQTLPTSKAHVVGLSLGGAVALEVTRTVPNAVDHLIVSGTSAGLGRWLGELTIFSAQAYRFFKPETLLEQSYKQFHIPEQYRAGFREDLLRSFNVGFTRRFTEALMQVQPPQQANALVAVGERETVVAKGDARKLVTSIQGARGVMAPKVGHVWNLERPDLFNQMVEAFVTGTPLPSELKTL